MKVPLAALTRCFQGIVPSIIATSDVEGTPNVTYLSQIYRVDDRHVALSRQFFNKTSRNLDANPYACVETCDPLTMQAYRFRLKFLRSETSGPLFDMMKLRIDAIASHTGLTGIFRLIAADIFEVQSVDLVDGFLQAPPPEVPDASLEGLRSEVRGLQFVSDRINRAPDLDALLDVVLQALEEYFHFSHTRVLLAMDGGDRLVTMASRGYGTSGVGAEVQIGEGLIGTVARERRLLRVTSIDADLRYGRAVRRESGEACQIEIPLPGLCDAQSMLAIPLVAGDRLIGVIAAEDPDPMRFGEWHEAYLEIVANQIATVLNRMLERGDEQVDAAPAAPTVVSTPSTGSGPTVRLTFYKNDEAIFVDDEYLIRNVPAKILWKLVGEAKRSGRREFSNRELRLDESLGLPPVKDNLESRLILLRRRLREKCPAIELVPTARGRFALRMPASLQLSER